MFQWRGWVNSFSPRHVRQRCTEPLAPWGPVLERSPRNFRCFNMCYFLKNWSDPPLPRHLELLRHFFESPKHLTFWGTLVRSYSPNILANCADFFLLGQPPHPPFLTKNLKITIIKKKCLNTFGLCLTPFPPPLEKKNLLRQHFFLGKLPQSVAAPC